MEQPLKREPYKFQAQKLKISQGKQKFLGLLQRISQRNRKERQSIVELKNILTEESGKISQEEEQIQREFYQVMRIKNQLERQIKNDMENLKEIQNLHVTTISKQIDNQMLLQKMRNKIHAEEKKEEINTELKTRIIKKNIS